LDDVPLTPQEDIKAMPKDQARELYSYILSDCETLANVLVKELERVDRSKKSAEDDDQFFEKACQLFRYCQEVIEIHQLTLKSGRMIDLDDQNEWLRRRFLAAEIQLWIDPKGFDGKSQCDVELLGAIRSDYVNKTIQKYTDLMTQGFDLDTKEKAEFEKMITQYKTSISPKEKSNLAAVVRSYRYTVDDKDKDECDKWLKILA
jgi:hypothetical protein